MSDTVFVNKNIVEKIWIQCPSCKKYQMTVVNDAVIRCNEHKCQFSDTTDGYLFDIASIDIDAAHSFIVDYGCSLYGSEIDAAHQLVFESSFLNILRDVYVAETLMNTLDTEQLYRVYEAGARYGVTLKMLKDVSEMSICELSDEEWDMYTKFAVLVSKDWSYAGFKKWMKNLSPDRYAIKY